MQHVDLKEIRSGAHVGKNVAVCGLERMLMYVTGMSNIRDVIEFSRTKDDLK